MYGKIDCSDPHWTTYLSLLELMGICFAYKVSLSSIINLKRLIKKHLTSFKKVYPNARISPKEHYLVHLPTQIMMFGPLIQTWCMRFEGMSWWRPVQFEKRKYPLYFTLPHHQWNIRSYTKRPLLMKRLVDNFIYVKVQFWRCLV